MYGNKNDVHKHHNKEKTGRKEIKYTDLLRGVIESNTIKVERSEEKELGQWKNKYKDRSLSEK